MHAPILIDAPDDPLQLFAAWYEEAEHCDRIRYAAAMCLSTVTPDGFPDGRIVLLHGVDASGFRFFTDRRSVKGEALARSPRAALTFYWEPLERQVRVQGRVAAAADEEADAFFRERPRRSQPTAWASAQSRPLPSRAVLEQLMTECERRFEGEPVVPRPPYWTAYRVVPRRIEFWAAGARRLHDRVLYTREEKGLWTHHRLYP